ncbi:DNA mismatch repair protein MutS [bacterium]|nr:DNA mismatch repair protein MutS [bacterium]
MRTPMMQQLHRVKKEFPNDVVFFRMGDFYEMFYDARSAHEILGLTLTKRSQGKGKTETVPFAGFPHHQLEVYLAKMTRAGRRVVVVDQVEDPKTAKGLVKREITRVVTTGTTMSEESLEMGKHQFLISLIRQNDLVGFALCDVTTGEFSASTIAFKEIKNFLDLFRPVEIILRHDQRDEFRSLLPDKIMQTQLEPWIYDYQFAHDTITSHFRVKTLKGFGIEDDELTVQAAGAMLHYIRDNLRTDPNHILSVSRLPTEQYMILDSATIRNLELIDPAWGTDRTSTLLHHIDRTVTPFGKRLFLRWLIRPLIKAEVIHKRHDATEELFNLSDTRKSARDQLRTLGDLERLTARLAANRSNPRDVAALRDTLRAIPLIKSTAASLESVALAEIKEELDPQDDLVAFLDSAIADEPPANLLSGGAIRDGFNERLDELRKLKKGGKDYIFGRQEEERQKTGINSLSIKYNRVHGYYIEVSKANQNKVPDHYIRKQTLVNSERYITPDLKEWEDKIVNAEEQLILLELELFETIRNRIIEQARTIQKNAHLLAELDVYSALAEVAVEHKYIRPKIVDSGRLRLVRSRHPVIENLLPDGEAFIANDLEIGDDNHQIALVTGPNMGGKSTYLRQVGLIVLMAQAGMFVPAEDAEIPLTDRIFTRVGASDNLAAGESTFLVEMQEAANILHNTSSKSLILLDEIGRGTSTFDGLSLAWAIVEHLHDFEGAGHPKTLFATHYHELTELETILGRVFNLHVEVKEWGERIIFLRKVIPGRSGASYGIQVAQLAGVPRPVIERAKEVLSALEKLEFTEEHLLPSRVEKQRVSEKAENSDSGSGSEAESSTAIPKPKLTRSFHPPPRKDDFQLTLFTVEERALRDKLASVNINAITPLEAIRLLANWQEQFPPIKDK